MEEHDFFTNINSTVLAKLIRQAKESIIIASPGIKLNIADELTVAAKTITPEMITVCLDVSEPIFRIGYGDFQAIEKLRTANILVHNVQHLRLALIIIDGLGYSFTPTALLLEEETLSSSGFNALRLTKEQSTIAASKLSPAAKAIALMQACSDEERKQISNTTTLFKKTRFKKNRLIQLRKS